MASDGAEVPMNDWFEAEQRIERAQQLTESQRWEEALAEIEAALAINPHNASWHAQRGFLLEELDRPEDAVDAFERSLELESEDRDVSIALGIALTRLGRLPRALRIFETLAKLYPDLEAAYCHRIHIYTELGRHDQAEEMFYLAQELREDCPHCFFSIGVSLAARGETERAVYCWQRVLELEPDYIGVHRRIAEAYSATGRTEEARERYLRELRNDPGNTDLLFDLAELMLDANQLASAAAKFTQILELEPDHIEARFALGKIWLLRKQPDKALHCFESLKDVEGMGDLYDFEWRIGEALVRLSRYREAVIHLKRAAIADDANLEILMLTGQALLAAKKVAEAANWFRRALSLDTRDATAHHHLGVCLLQLGRDESALSHCEEAIRHKAEYTAAMYSASVANIHLRRWRAARRMINRALRLEPNNEAVTNLSKRLWKYRLRATIHYVARFVGLRSR